MEIMKIDEEINEIVKSRKYRHIQDNLRKLRRRGGGSLIEIEHPDDGRKVRVRWNSDELSRYLRNYEGQMKEYSVRLDNLRRKKKKLTSDLF
jgi:hypothetical protein